MESLKKLDLNVTITRIMATVAVVLLHTSSTITGNPDIFSYSSSQEKFFLIVAKLLRCAVPLFFMISGKLMLSGKRKLTYDKILKNMFVEFCLHLYCLVSHSLQSKVILRLRPFRLL